MIESLTIRIHVHYLELAVAGKHNLLHQQHAHVSMLFYILEQILSSSNQRLMSLHVFPRERGESPNIYIHSPQYPPVVETIQLPDWAAQDPGEQCSHVQGIPRLLLKCNVPVPQRVGAVVAAIVGHPTLVYAAGQRLEDKCLHRAGAFAVHPD